MLLRSQAGFGACLDELVKLEDFHQRTLAAEGRNLQQRLHCSELLALLDRFCGSHGVKSPVVVFI